MFICTPQYMNASTSMDAKIAKAILRKLYRDGRIGGRHTSVDHVPKGFRRDKAGDVKTTLKKLRTRGFVIFKPTNYGTQVSLNPSRIEEIEEIIRDP